MQPLTIDLTKQVVLTEKNLIQYKEKNTNNSVPFVITYHPALSNLSNIVREHWTTFGKLKVTIIDHNAKWDDKSRQERESFWIRKRKMESMKTSNILSWLLFLLVSSSKVYIPHCGGPFFYEFGHHTVFKNIFDSAIWYINQ